MVKYILLTLTAVILFAVLFYKVHLYSPIYHVTEESENFYKDRESDLKSINYIVTTGISERISIQEIESVTSERNFSFTMYNMNNSIRLKVPVQRL